MCYLTVGNPGLIRLEKNCLALETAFLFNRFFLPEKKSHNFKPIG